MWMKLPKIAVLAAFCALIPADAGAMRLQSATFHANAAIPVASAYDRDGCRGGNRAPQLSWQNVPSRTRSFALVVHDPDAPAPGGWWHWARFDIPAALRSLPFGVRNGTDGRDARTSWREQGYDGPCPPPGPPHHYVFTLFALDVVHVAGVDSEMTAPELVRALRGHILARATLVGRYGAR